MSEEEDPNYSIVEYMNDHSGYKCGYCKAEDTNYSHGMWAHRLSVGDYQELINRGWRRSGKYCYKPTMDKTCCPHYTIKCEALNFKISKSQKKVLKRMHNFLSFGKMKSDNEDIEATSEPSGINEFEQFQPRTTVETDMTGLRVNMKNFIKKGDSTAKSSDKSENAHCCTTSEHRNETSSVPVYKTVQTGSGPDTTKPPCKKAKLIRQERRKTKYGASSEPPQKNNYKNAPKSLEGILNEPLPENPAHHLELRLIRMAVPYAESFQLTRKKSYRVYREYQMTIHKESEDDCREHSFINFLVDSPLMPWKPCEGPPTGYGSFHQQYWLDNELIAVGVIDILPQCLSSVYLYYDPKYSFLSLGTYSSLREIALTKELNGSSPNLKWYYMGYYIHSCPKMRYKGRYFPSYLLCPEKYTWEPIEKCLTKLDVNKYSVLNEDGASLAEELDVNKVLCLHDGMPMLYGTYKQFRSERGTVPDDEEVQEYASLAGTKCANSMLLYRV